MEALYENLKLIESISLLFYGASFALIYRTLKITKICYSFTVSLFILVVFNLMMFGYLEILLWWDKLDEEPSKLLNFFWYIGFAAFYVLGILSLYGIHKKENIRIGKFGQYVSFSFCISGMLQLARYVEIVLYKTIDTTHFIYTFGIPAINICTVFIALGLAITVNYYTFAKKNGLRTIERWSL